MSLKIAFVGDIFLQNNNDEDPFIHVTEELTKYDLVVPNLETVLLDDDLEGREKRVRIRAAENSAELLSKNKMCAVNIANNHIFDFNEAGFLNTVKVLQEHMIKIIGTSEPVIMELGGYKIGFLGYYDNADGKYIARLNLPLIKGAVASLKKTVDYVFVIIHWGIEYINYPSPLQRRIAHQIIDYGVDVIIGHHPHVIQSYESYRGKPIFYSLGNFQFGVEQDDSFVNANQGWMVIFEVNSSKINYKIKHIQIDSKFRPHIHHFNRKYFHDLTHISNDLRYSLFWHSFISCIYLKSQYQSWGVRIKKYGIRHLFQCIRRTFSLFYLKLFLALLLRPIIFRTKYFKKVV